MLSEPLKRQWDPADDDALVAARFALDLRDYDSPSAAGRGPSVHLDMTRFEIHERLAYDTVLEFPAPERALTHAPPPSP